MARSSSPIAQMVVLGVLGLFAFNWAEKQPGGSSARNTADQVKRALGGVLGSASAPLSSQPGFTQQRQGEQAGGLDRGHGAVPRPGGGVVIVTRLEDFGQFPVVYDPIVGTMAQDPNVGGTNVYAPGDGFIDPTTGKTWIWQGGTSFSDGGGGAAQLTDFEG